MHSLRPFPLVPTELQQHILSFSDPPTLASACACSFAFLELASPLLYSSLHINGVSGLRALFVKRTPQAQPSLRPFLDLSRQVESFTFELTNEDYSDCTPITRDRLPSDQLLVKNLEVRFPNPGFEPLLFPLVDPINVALVGTQTSSLSRPDLNMTPWPRLRSLSLVGAVFPMSPLYYAELLFRGTEDRRITVVLDFFRGPNGASLPAEAHQLHTQLLETTLRGAPLGSIRIKEINIKTPQSYEVNEMVERVLSSFTWIDEDVRAEWRTRLRLETF